VTKAVPWIALALVYPLAAALLACHWAPPLAALAPLRSLGVPLSGALLLSAVSVWLLPAAMLGIALSDALPKEDAPLHRLVGLHLRFSPLFAAALLALAAAVLRSAHHWDGLLSDEGLSFPAEVLFGSGGLMMLVGAWLFAGGRSRKSEFGESSLVIETTGSAPGSEMRARLTLEKPLKSLKAKLELYGEDDKPLSSASVTVEDAETDSGGRSIYRLSARLPKDAPVPSGGGWALSVTGRGEKGGRFEDGANLEAS
jgi:hypothetical protein